MENPQDEERFTKVPNEILDALRKVNLSQYESRVIFYLWRKTYGWHKKTDRIALTQFVENIGLDRRLIHRTLKKLESRCLIVIKRDVNGDRTYGFQEDYEKWRNVQRKKKKVISGDDSNCASNGNEVDKQATIMAAPKAEPPYPSSPEMSKLSSSETPTKENTKEKKIVREPRNPDVGKFLNFWAETFKEKFGDPYDMKWGKEGKLIKTLLETYGLDRLRGLAEIFFNSKDPFMQKAGFTIGVFKSQINKLIPKEKKLFDGTASYRSTEELLRREDEARASMVFIDVNRVRPQGMEGRVS
jgi:phage replication O-like protein O